MGIQARDRVEPYGYDPLSSTWVPLSVDSTGRLTVAASPGAGHEQDEVPTTVLSAGQVFTGNWHTVKYHQALIVLYAIQPTSEAPASVQIQWSNDAVDGTTSGTVLTSSTLMQKLVTNSGLTYAVYLSIVNNMQAAFYRLKVTQSGTATTSVPIAISWRAPHSFNGSYGYLDAPLNFFSQGLLTRAVGAGIQPDGTFINLPAGGRSTGNNTTTPLGAAGTWSGAWESRVGYVSVNVLVSSDQVSATSGLIIEHSDDAAGLNVRSTERFTYDTAQVAVGSMYITTAPRADYFRVSYTNGGTPQGVFFLETCLQTTAIETPRQSVEGQIIPASNAMMVRAILNAKNDIGTYGNLLRSALGGLRISVLEHEAETPIKALTTGVNSATSVGTTAVQLVSTPLTSRKTVSVKVICGNNQFVYIGFSSAVTTSNGYQLRDGEAIDVELSGTNSVLWAITNTGTQSARILEIA